MHPFFQLMYTKKRTQNTWNRKLIGILILNMYVYHIAQCTQDTERELFFISSYLNAFQSVSMSLKEERADAMGRKGKGHEWKKERRKESMLCVCVCLNAEIKYSKQQPNVWYIQYQHEFMTLNTIRSESFRCMNCHNNKLICEIANARKLNAKYCDVWLSLLLSCICFSLPFDFVLFGGSYIRVHWFPVCICELEHVQAFNLSMVLVSLCAPLLLHFICTFISMFLFALPTALPLPLSISFSSFICLFVCLAFIWFTWKTWCTFSCLFLTSYRIYEYAKEKWQR